MNKKTQELLNNLPKKKSLYNRYDGEILEYKELENGYYIDVRTGTIFQKEEWLMLGETSENLIDLIEKGDYVNGELVEGIWEKTDKIPRMIQTENENLYDEEIKTVLTHEEYEKYCFRKE